MAITYGFFNSINGDRKYNAANIGRYLHGIVSSGVYADTSSSLQVLASDGRTVHVQAGRAMLDYHYMENDAPLALTLAAGSTQDRYDAVVAVLDVKARLCDIVIREGQPAASPKVPVVQRSDDMKEYMLAYVYIPKYATTITQENITDTRPDNSVCGWVHGIIQQVDTSTLHAQYEAAYAAKMAELDVYIANKKADIDSRLESIDNALNDTEVAGLPIPTASNAGQVPTVNKWGTRYTLADLPLLVSTVQTSDTFTVSAFTEDDVGLHLFKSPESIPVYCKTDSEARQQIGKLLANSLCYVGHTSLLGASGEVGKIITLTDITSGKTYKATVRWDADGVETSWTYTVESRFVCTVNGSKPDAAGNVTA